MSKKGIISLKKFASILFQSCKESSDRTILIQNIPERIRIAETLKKIIESKFIDIEVTAITFTYDVERLKRLLKRKQVFESALNYCQEYLNKKQEKLLINPYCCGQLFGVKCCPYSVCGICYYRERIKNCENKIITELQVILSQPKHAVFVQLKNVFMAQRILDHFDYTKHQRLLTKFLSQLKFCLFKHKDSDLNGYNIWLTQAAPFPEDIEW